SLHDALPISGPEPAPDDDGPEPDRGQPGQGEGAGPDVGPHDRVAEDQAGEREHEAEQALLGHDGERPLDRGGVVEGRQPAEAQRPEAGQGDAPPALGGQAGPPRVTHDGEERAGGPLTAGGGVARPGGRRGGAGRAGGRAAGWRGRGRWRPGHGGGHRSSSLNTLSSESSSGRTSSSRAPASRATRGSSSASSPARGAETTR